MPIFPSVEWFDEVRHLMNSDESVRTAGGGMCDATVGIKCDDQVYILVFEGFECSSANQVSEDDLVNSDFYIEMTSSEWSLMLIYIKEPIPWPTKMPNPYGFCGSGISCKHRAGQSH